MNTATRKGLYVSFAATFVITVIIVALIDVFVGGNPVNTVENLAADLFVPNLITAVICGGIQVIMTSSSVKKGKPVMACGNVSDQLAFLFYPKNTIPYLLLSSVVLGLIFGCMPVGIVYCFAPGFSLSFAPYVALKSMISGLTAAFAGTFGSVFCAGLHNEKAATVTKE